MKTVPFSSGTVNGWPWGWGARLLPREGTCRLCGWPGRKKVPKSSLIGIHRMHNGMDLCTTCARRTLDVAFGRPLDSEELSAVRAGRACLAVPMPDHLAQLYLRTP